MHVFETAFPYKVAWPPCAINIPKYAYGREKEALLLFTLYFQFTSVTFCFVCLIDFILLGL